MIYERVHIKLFNLRKKSRYKTKTYFKIFHSKKKKPNRSRHEKNKSISIRFNNRHCQMQRIKCIEKKT